MEWVISLLGILFAGGSIWNIFYYNSKKRNESAKADITETEANTASFGLLGKKVDYIDDQLDNAYKQINSMQALIDDFRGQVVQLQKQLSEVQIELIKEKTEHEKTRLRLMELEQKYGVQQAKS